MVDRSNKFENLNLRTAIEAPVRPGTTGTPPPQLPKIDSDSAPEGPRHSTPERKFPWKRVIAVPTIVALGTAGFFGVKALTDGQGSPKPEPVATGPANPGTGTDNGETQTDSGDRISPETLAKLTPEQIATFADITAVKADGTLLTPEEYAATQVSLLSAFFNAGITPGEFKPFNNKPAGEYSASMQDKYAPMLSSIYADPNKQGFAVDTHIVSLNLAGVAYSLGYDTYQSNIEIVSPIVVTEPQTSVDDDFTFTETLHYTDNSKEVGLIDLYKGTPREIKPLDTQITYSVHVMNIDGKLKSTVEQIK